MKLSFEGQVLEVGGHPPEVSLSFFAGYRDLVIPLRSDQARAIATDLLFKRVRVVIEISESQQPSTA